MPSNPWLAIDVTTAPAIRARKLRRIWDDFLGNGRLEAVRLPIADSWQRSQAAGVDPAGTRAPTVLPDRDDVAGRWEAHPLQAAAPAIREWLWAIADESEHLIVVSDADGLLLWVDGNAKVRSAAADTMNFVEGALWSEGGAGTNAIGTALAADHPVQVHAAEHFSEVVHGWTCSAAPVHDPESGRLLGIIDLTGRMTTAHPHSFAVALATAHVVEAGLRARMQEEDARLRARHLASIGPRGEQRALVSRTGRVLADHPDGFLRAERLEIPPGGGELILPSGQPAFAEPVGDSEAFIVRGDRRRQPGVDGVARGLTGRARAQMELSWLAEEQAALRRVAMLVAGPAAAAEEIFAAVAEEVALLFRADRGVVCRYESDESMTVVAYWSEEGRTLPVGTRVGLEGGSLAAMVQRSGSPGRVAGYEGLSGPVIELARTLGAMARSTVGAPIVVEGRVWGAILASSTRPEPFPDDAESRMMGFAELVAAAISDAVGREQLAASRARIVATADETRRRIERNLHDGLQQRLVTLGLELQGIQAAAPTRPVLLAELSRIQAELGSTLDDLREISRGIHPAILSNGGLAPALRALARRSAIPVELEVPLNGRLPEPVEVTTYYVVSEALTNAAKYAHASVVRVAVEQQNGTLHLSVRDDGAGGADPERGSGLTGLRDRIEAIGGTLVVESPVGAGTSLLVALPVK
jgi:signal transduction histidine kinase